MIYNEKEFNVVLTKETDNNVAIAKELKFLNLKIEKEFSFFASIVKEANFNVKPEFEEI